MKKKKRRRARGRGKGQQFERDTCRRLSLWVSKDKRDDLYWRSPGSGSVATRSKGKRKTGLGDVESISPKGAWLTRWSVIETKFYRDLHIDSDLIYGGKRGIRPFWNKLKMLCKLVNRTPMLIAKQNKKPELCCIELSAALMLSVASSLNDGKRIRPLATFPEVEMGVYLLKDFLKLPPETWRRYVTDIGPARNRSKK